MTAKTNHRTAIQFLFTPDGFTPDLSCLGTQAELQEAQRWAKDNGYPALYQLGLEGKPEEAGPSESFLYQVASAFFHRLTDLPELEIARGKAKVILTDEAAEELLWTVPFVIGAEHITKKWLRNIFQEMNALFSQEISAYDGTVEMYLTEKNQKLRVPERVFFHLVENKDADFPFAFLATYATKGEKGRIRHVPLKYALTEYQNDRAKLLALLSCLNRAAEVSELIGGFMDSGELFHPLRLTAEEAYTFLKQIEDIENTGILCRIPNWWRKNAASVSMAVSLGDEKPSMLGFDSLISMKPKLMVDGVELTEDEVRQLLAQTEGLAFLKGKWIEVDHARLERLLKEMEEQSREITLMDAPADGDGDSGGRKRSGCRCANHQRQMAVLPSGKSAQAGENPQSSRSCHGEGQTASLSEKWLRMA